MDADMQSKIILLSLIFASFFPKLSYARGIPLFFNTGDELFEVNNAPDLGEGYKLGYACKHFGLFGADLWSWDCELLRVDKANFTAAKLDTETVAKYESLYPLSTQDRNFWNHYGVIFMLLILGSYGFYKTQTA